MEGKNIVLGIVTVLAIALLIFGITQVGKVSDLKDENAKLSDSVETVSKTLDSVKADITDLETSLEQKQADIEARDAAIAEQNAAISALEEEKAALEQEKETVVAEEDLAGVEYYELERALGEDFEVTVKENRIDKLFDGIVEFDGDDLDAYDALYLSDNVKTMVSGVYDNEFDDTIYLGTSASNAIEYRFVFKDSFDINNVDDDETLTIPLLGKDVEIVEVLSNDKVKIKSSEEFYGNVGDTFDVDGQVVTIINIGEEAVLIDVDGQKEIIETGKTESFDNLEVSVSDVFYEDTVTERLAVLKIGEEITKIVEDGDAAIMFGQDEDEPMWVWSIDLPNYIGFRTDFRLDDLDETYTPLAVGDCLVLPNDYLNVCFEELTNVNYEDITIDFDEKDVNNIDSPENVVVFKADEDSFVLGGEEVDTVYVSTSGDVFYKNGSDYVLAATGSFDVEYDETEFTVDASGTSFDFGSDWSFEVSSAFDEFVDMSYLTVSVDNFDETFVDLYGFVVEDPENSLDDDSVTFSIPDEQVLATVRIY